MPDKPWNKLNPIDKQIRNLAQDFGMKNGTQVRISLIYGFEYFNTRSYHNYETFSNGYMVELLNPEGEVFLLVQKEDLDDALNLAEKKFKEFKEDTDQDKMTKYTNFYKKKNLTKQ